MFTLENQLPQNKLPQNKIAVTQAYSTPFIPVTRQTQIGLTLVELLIATILSTVLLSALLKVYMDSKFTYVLSQSKSELQSEARASLRILSRVVEQAGYRNQRDIRQSNETVFPANTSFAAGQVIRASAINATGGWMIETRTQGDSDGLLADCLGFTHDDDLIVTQTLTFDPTTQTLMCAVRCSSTHPDAVLCSNQQAVLTDRLRALDMLVGMDATNNDRVLDRYQNISSLNGSESNVLTVKALGWYESQQNVLSTDQSQELDTFSGSLSENDRKLRLAFSDTFSVRGRLP